MNKFFKYTLIFLVVYLAVSLITMPHICIDAAKSAVTLCLDAVIPSLFPFFVCSGLLTALGASALCSRYLSPFMRPLFNVPGSGALSFMLGIVSGYPLGAASAADLYRSGECTKAEAQRMTAFCNNSGPLFIMGVVGVGILSDPKIGRYLYISHILSAILTGMLLRFLPECAPGGQKQLPPSPSRDIKNTAHITIGSVIDNSVFSMLKVCGFIVFFSVIGAVLPRFGFTPYIHAILEITGGIKAVAAIEADPTFKLSLISFFIAFSGVSVLLQVNAVISPCGLSVMPYFLGKLLQGVISFIITYLILTYFPITTDVFSENAAPLFQSIHPLRAFTVSVLCLVSATAITAFACSAARVCKKDRY